MLKGGLSKILFFRLGQAHTASDQRCGIIEIGIGMQGAENLIEQAQIPQYDHEVLETDTGVTRLDFAHGLPRDAQSLGYITLPNSMSYAPLLGQKADSLQFIFTLNGKVIKGLSALCDWFAGLA